MNEIDNQLILEYAKKLSPRARFLAEWMFGWKTEYGMDIDGFYERMIEDGLNVTRDEFICATMLYLGMMVEHSLRGGMPFLGERHKKMQKRNVDILKRLIEGQTVDYD